MGEWATREGRDATPNLNAALGDAAWMAGMERNSDVVLMSSYAPLLVNVNKGAMQWNFDLIGYDALNSFGSPSYYAQKMFRENLGDTVLPVDFTGPTPDAASFEPSGTVSLATASVAEFKDVLVAQDDKVLLKSDFRKGTKEWAFHGKSALDDGALKLSASRVSALKGESTWANYILTLKARCLDDAGAISVIVHTDDAGNWTAWNLGGKKGESRLDATRDGAAKPFGDTAKLVLDKDRW